MKNLILLAVLFAVFLPTQAMALGTDNCARSAMDPNDCASIVSDLETFNDDWIAEFDANTLTANILDFYNDPDTDHLSVLADPTSGALCDPEGEYILGFTEFEAFTAGFSNVTWSNTVVNTRHVHALNEISGAIMFEFTTDFSIDIGPGGPLTGVFHVFFQHTVQEVDENEGELRIVTGMTYGSFIFD